MSLLILVDFKRQHVPFDTPSKLTRRSDLINGFNIFTMHHKFGIKIGEGGS